MPWSLLLDLRVLLGLALVATGIYAAVQRMEKEHCQAAAAIFRADVAKAGEEAKTKIALEHARIATNAQEAVSDLQTRLDRLNRSYASLRDSRPGSSGVPNLSSAAPSLSACGPQPSQPDATARFLERLEAGIAAILETGDREIAKYVELWKLEQANAQH